MSHVVHIDLLQDKVEVVLVGCGGNGSQMLSGLAQLHLGMKAMGHPGGLHVTTYDPDRVSEANVGRQLFSMADVGQYKAVVLTTRLNAYFGLDWTARPLPYTGPQTKGLIPPASDLLITCVDTARARREIGAAIVKDARQVPKYWLDLGNQRFFGQVILGEPRSPVSNKTLGRIGRSTHFVGDAETFQKTWGPLARRPLPTVLDKNPELKDKHFVEDDTPSCSLAEALEKQSLFINRHVSCWALTLLETMFRTGRLDVHGYFVNLESGHVNPIPVPQDK